ncbi:AAA family ATPase, partial [bacterium]|nr:AAA family ATPase [bacterium]
GSNFLEINDTITKRLTERSNGLYMFHGLPGTGKTTYIKYLANIIDRDFIYVPTNMLEYFTTDPTSISILLRRPNSVLILEDAEKAILKRENTDASNSSVSSLLNLSDGIMSDIVRTAIILTYNCSKQDIDKALKRKGRLQMDYEFRLLTKEEATKLAKKLKYPKKIIEDEITGDISLADIYNLQTKVDFYEKKEKEKRIIGFGS